VSQINLLIDTMIASMLIAGSVSWLYYSDRLLELPLALIGIALATVALAKLSHYYAKNNTIEFTNTVNKALLYALLLGLPSCVGLVMLSEELIVTLFRYQEFDRYAAEQSSLSLKAYGAGLMAFIAIKILAPVFLSRGDTKTPVKAGIVAMVSNIFLNVVLAYYYGHVGLAAATSISALLNAAFLYYYLRKQSIFKLNNEFFKMLFKVFFASIIMALYVYFTSTNIESYFQSVALDRIVMISKTILISVLIYFSSLYLMGIRINRI